MKQYVIYKRVSTEDQGRSGLGLAAQDRDLNLFLETFSEEPWEVLGEFVDVLSGSDDHRPELTRALDLAKRTGAELLVAKLDRLSRRVSFVAGLLEDRKLHLRVASMPYADKFQLHIFSALAEQERDFISKRTKAALAEAKERGVKLGCPADTLTQRNGALKANAQARAENLEKIVKPLRERGATLRDIAATLNESGVPTARGGKWHSAQVGLVLKRLEAT